MLQGAFVLFFVHFCLSAFLFFPKNKSNQELFIIILMVLTFIAAARSSGFGSDDAAYVSILNNVSSIINRDGFFNTILNYTYAKFNVEFLYFVIVCIISLFSTSSHLLFFIICGTSLLLNLTVIYRLSPFFVASVLIYFCHFFLAKELNAIRSGLASAILFYAALQVYFYRYAKAAFLFFAAMLFHVSSIFFVAPILLLKLKPSRLVLISLFIFALFFGFFFDFKSVFNSFFWLGSFGEKLKLYNNAEQYSYAIKVFDIVNVKNMLLVFLAFSFWDSLNQKYNSFYFCFLFFYASVLIRMLFSDFAIIAGRGYSMISMFEFIIIPMLCYAIFNKITASLLLIFYTSIMLYMNLNYNLSWHGGVDFFDYWY